jgi:Tol biopolymer transport system component
VAYYRSLAPGQVARIHIHDVETGGDVVVHESRDVLFEAPNWTMDGQALLVNGDGVMWSIGTEAGSSPVRIEHHGLPEANNDHVLDPDGQHIFLSAMDKHIYRGLIAGGAVTRVTSEPDVWHFLHGVSPDGKRLAYVRITAFDQPGRLALKSIPEASEPALVDTGAGHIDGPEWSPDGQWIYFNTERWADRPGHAQLARIPDLGGEVERLVSSDTVDWFPHLSPDGGVAVYIEFPTGTEGHPADLAVQLVVVSTDDWSTPLKRIAVPGGQGTINVNSWAPDSRRFAYVSYPTV